MVSRDRTSGCALLLVLVVLQQCAGRETLKEAIVRSFDGTMRNMANDAPLEYSKVNLSTSYNSSATFDPKAMEQLYYVTNFFMHAIQPDDLYPEEFVKVDNGQLSYAELATEWSTLVRHYAGIVSVIAVGLLFLILMPLVGLIFCCCRCAGCCGAKNQPFEKQRDPCKRITLGIMLAIIATIILFGVVCAFVTNEYMEDGIQTLPSKLTIAVNDTNHYFTNTKMEIKHLLITNFKELQAELENTLNYGGRQISDMFKNFSNAAVMDNLTAMVDEFVNIEQDLNTIQNLSASLQNNALGLSNGLIEVQTNLTNELKNCSSNHNCEELLKAEISQLNSTGDFDKVLDRYFPKLPNITQNLAEMKNITELKLSISKGKAALDNISISINETIQDFLPQFLTTIQSAGEAIEITADKLTGVMNNVTTVVDSESKPLLSDLDRIIKYYGSYRYYVDISTSSVMLLILFCITLGLFYGFCGKRPDSGYGDDCCSKTTGARFLMLGVYVMFIFSAVLMIITLAHFLAGITVEKVVCQSLRSPENSQLLVLLDKITPLNFGSKVNISINGVLSSCHMNNSIYKVLQVSDIVNITEVLEYSKTYTIEEKIKDLEDSINFNENITFLDDQTEQQLLNIGNSSLNDLTGFTSVLNNSVVDIDLMNLASKLNCTANELNNTAVNNTANSLREQAVILEDLHNTFVKVMMKEIEDLKNITDSVQERLKFNRSSLADAVNEIVTDVVQAQVNGPHFMSEVVNIFATHIVEYINNYLHQIVNTTVEDVGRCGPISQVFNATLVATCDDILNPFNGFWASIGWCLVLFIPAIILSVKLTTLYRKSDPYHTALPDSEYLYDAYADRDNIPLANGPDKKNHHRRYNETYDNSSGYMGDYNAHLGRGDRDRRDRASSGHRPDDARYTDMAPKTEKACHHVLSGLPVLTVDNLRNKTQNGSPGVSSKHPKWSMNNLSKREDNENYHTLSGLPKLSKDNVKTKEQKQNRILSGLPKLTKSILENFQYMVKNGFRRQHHTEAFTSLPRLNSNQLKMANLHS